MSAQKEWDKKREAMHKPFPTSNQYADWSSRNCGSCRKGFDQNHGKFRCDYECNLAYAYCGDGQVTEEVAKAIGYLDSEGCDLWQCSGWARR